MLYSQLLEALFEKDRHEENAYFMAKYMKNHFPFLGIKTPTRNELMKQFFSQSDILKQELQLDFVEELWNKEEREYQYAALHYLKKEVKKVNVAHLQFLESLITRKSWWDTVDIITPHLVGKIAKETPSIIDTTIKSWASGEHLWLIRSAILYQLKYKEQTDEARLYEMIRANSHHNEFFIQKAIGWALREYSKTNPASVRKFIESTPTLAKLSVREGSKYI